MRATIRPMYGWGEDERTYRLYFSFVPCRPAVGPHSGFARPVLKLDGLINPNARRQARMLDANPERIPELWQMVVDAVVSEDLALATRLELDEQV